MQHARSSFHQLHFRKMKYLVLFWIIALAPIVGAVDSGVSIGIGVTTEEFQPLIWMCDSRLTADDCVEEGRTSNCGEQLIERMNNYAFEGEQISWLVLVMDKNKIEEITDVVGTIGSSQGVGNGIEVECARTSGPTTIPNTCNARILEEKLTEFDDDTMAYYGCTFTVETPNSMYGEYWLSVEAISTDGEASMDENEYWFFNPIIGVNVVGDLSFDNVRPGTLAYDSLLIGNDADQGSGVLLDMFITGTDFFDSSSSGAKCPSSNVLALTNLRYYSTMGAYSTLIDPRSDAEGYVGINYGDMFSRSFYDSAEIIQGPIDPNGYYAGNVLAAGAKMPLTFKLSLPEPCKGNFDDGNLYFWGEAI